MKVLVFLLLGALCVWGEVAKERYEDYKVFRMYPETEEQKSLFARLEKNDGLDFWNGVNNAGRPVDVMVKPQDQTRFVQEMGRAGIQPEVFIEDVQTILDKERVGSLTDSNMNWLDYFPLDDINAWMDHMAAQYPDKASVVVGGSTYEGREIKGLKISFGTGKRIVFLEGGTHAREWISPATVTYLANQILTSTDEAFRKIAHSFDWYIFPVTNPDGYSFTFTNNRFWVKTRKPYGSCYGADPKRNWDAHWSEYGVSGIPCDNSYGGPIVFSETATYTLSNFIKTIGSKIDVHLAFHSYNQFLMVPYGHTLEHLENYNDTVAIGEKAVEALAKRYGTSYRVGNIAEEFYHASGSSSDWVKQEFHTPLVYIYQLRDRGEYGYLLPPSQIIPNCEEVQDSIVAMFQEAEKKGYFTLGS